MPNQLPDQLSRATIESALAEFSGGRAHNFADSTGYDLLYEGKRFPPKAIVGLAAEIATGLAYFPDDFSGGLGSKCFRLLEEAGFEIRAKSESNVSSEELPFVVGREYNRLRDIHSQYKGQQQGGISTPLETSFIFLFTGESGTRYGYKDGFVDGVFWLTGEGQKGDMQMVRGNLAIKDHLQNGKRLLLFEYTRKSTVSFMGEASYLAHHFDQKLDLDGNMRNAIVFELELDTESRRSPSEPIVENSEVNEDRLWSLPLSDLKNLADAPSPKGAATTVRRQVVRMRSKAVKIYAQKRANGICECCDKPAPFKTPKRRAFLETHHLTRLADGGPDLPEFVAAICPNCHREIHLGFSGANINADLLNKISLLEGKQGNQSSY